MIAVAEGGCSSSRLIIRDSLLGRWDSLNIISSYPGGSTERGCYGLLLIRRRALGLNSVLVKGSELLVSEGQRELLSVAERA